MDIKKFHIEKQLTHIYNVQNYMILLEMNLSKLPFKINEWEILYRSMFHDLDKFNKNIANGYCKIRKYIMDNNITKVDYNLFEQNSDGIFESLLLHHKNNLHHFEYHEENKCDFSNLDICEMCCDMLDKSINHKKNPKEYLEENLIPRSLYVENHKDEIIYIFNLLNELLNNKQEYNNEDLIKKQFIEREIFHMRLVHKYMILLELNRDKLPFKIEEYDIIYRAMFHDIDKFSVEMADKYCLIQEYYNNKRKKGFDNLYVNEDVLYECCKVHYKTQRHHIPFHIENKCDFSNLDICEFCCDLFAKSTAYKDDPVKYFNENILKNFEKYKDNVYCIFNILKKLNKEDNFDYFNTFISK